MSALESLASMVLLAFTPTPLLFFLFSSGSLDTVTPVALLSQDGSLEAHSLMIFFLSLYVISLMFFFMLGDFLGLYGVFTGLCAVSLLFWLSLLNNFFFFFFEGGESWMNLSSLASLSPSLEVGASLSLDMMSYSFLLLTMTMAVFVNFFAFSYFSYEPLVDSLLLLLNAFVLSMGVLVMSANLVVLFFGWEMMGLTSFLLINFWQTRVGTLKSAFKAYSFNKFSDASLLMFLVYYYLLFGDLDMSVGDLLHPSLPSMVDSSFLLFKPLDLMALFLVSSAFVKSAQLGFHMWLPDSMEAPVPASALMHSATLVSAGMFLVVSLQHMVELSGFMSSLVPIVGSVTAFVGGFSALTQTDLKSVLAYSTMSHCGFLFVLAFSGTLEHTLLYLYVHGFFKASSFLCVGSVLSFTHGYQDVSSMGGFWKYLPAEFYFLLLCLSSLAGMPLFLGYSVKHLVLSANWGSAYSLVCGSFVLLAAFAGLFYSWSMLYFVFFDSKKARKSFYLSAAAQPLKSYYYSNTTLASNFSIAGLALTAYAISFVAALSLVADQSFGVLDGSSVFGLEMAAGAASLDLGLVFNFKLLNSIVLVLFLFMNFFCWSSSVSLSYSTLATLVLTLLLA